MCVQVRRAFHHRLDFLPPFFLILRLQDHVLDALIIFWEDEEKNRSTQIRYRNDRSQKALLFYYHSSGSLSDQKDPPPGWWWRWVLGNKKKMKDFFLLLLGGFNPIFVSCFWIFISHHLNSGLEEVGYYGHRTGTVAAGGAGASKKWWKRWSSRDRLALGVDAAPTSRTDSGRRKTCCQLLPLVVVVPVSLSLSLPSR